MATFDDAKLAATFRDRVVLVGNITRKTDRWPLPVKLLEDDPDASGGQLAYSQPGVLIHAQVLRSHFAGALLHPLSQPLKWVLVIAAALAPPFPSRTGP